MALISIMSAKGAPGATTTAMLLANLWPAPTYLVDADPLGGDIALRLKGVSGPLDAGRGLMSLLPAARRGLPPEGVAQHAQIAIGGQPVLGGLPGPEQAVAVTPLWPTLAQAFADLPGADVVADIGQTHSRSSHLAMAEQSAALICVFRPTAWSVVHTRQRLETLADLLRDRNVEVGIACVARPDDEANARAAASSITAGLTWVTDYGTVADDPGAVVMYEGGVVYRPERTLLARSGTALALRLYADLGSRTTPVPKTPEQVAAEEAEAIDPSGGRSRRSNDRGARRAPRSRRGRKERQS